MDDSSLSSALFGNQIPPINEDPSGTTAGQQTSIPPAAPPAPAAASLTAAPRASTASPVTIELASPQPIAVPSPGPVPPYSPLYKPAALPRMPMPNSALPGSAAAFEGDSANYPAHLSQARPQQDSVPPSSSPPPSNATPPSNGSPANNSISTSPNAQSAAAAPAVPARSAQRYRDFTLGGSPGFASAMNLTTQNMPAVNGNTSFATPNLPSTGPDSPAAALGAGPRRPSASGPSGSRKPSSTGSTPGSRRGGDKEGSDSPNDLGHTSRRSDPRLRRPPRARERVSTANNDADGDGEDEQTDRLVYPALPSAKVSRAPASAMYFSPVPAHGRPPAQCLRAHAGTLVGDKIWFVGGVDAHSCWRGIASFDTESLQWSTIQTTGEPIPALRAHTTTLVGDTLYIFGGGDGPTYSNDVWTFNTVTHQFLHPVVATPRNALPPPRRAHTTVLYNNFLVIFGGGNGQAALNDVWALDVSDPSRLTWQEWRTRGDVPQKKGYHTANLVGDKMIVFGGSDGHASFADVHVLNLVTLTWTLVNTEIKHNRLSHTSTQVGSYLFVIGGHNGQTYAQDVLLFNLVTLAWESKVPRGIPPPGRGYHVAVLHDARIFVSGGYNGVSVFDDLWSLDLGAGAYLPQVVS